MLFLVFGVSNATSNQEARTDVDPSQKYLSGALAEVAADFGYELSIASDQWAEFPVLAIPKHGTMHERLGDLLDGMSYVLEHKGLMRIVVRILSEIPSERRLSESGQQQGGKWVLLYGPEGLEEWIWVKNEQSEEPGFRKNLELRYTSDGLEEWVSANRVQQADRPVRQMFTSEGLEEWVSEGKEQETKSPVRRMFTSEGLEEWVSEGKEQETRLPVKQMFTPEGLEELISVRELTN